MNIYKELRKKHNLTQIEFANKIHVDQSTVSKWEQDKAVPDIQTLGIIANFFNVSIDYLLGREVLTPIQDSLVYKFDNIKPITTQKIPLLGEIACGKPIFVNEDRESYVEIGTDIKADFCLKAKGDSMVGARIQDGDIVFVRQQSIVNNGEIGVVVVDNEATLKRVFYDEKKATITLVAENSKYPPLTFQGEELNEIVILGKAIAFQSDL